MRNECGLSFSSWIFHTNSSELFENYVACDRYVLILYLQKRKFAKKSQKVEKVCVQPAEPSTNSAANFSDFSVNKSLIAVYFWIFAFNNTIMIFTYSSPFFSFTKISLC